MNEIPSPTVGSKEMQAFAARFGAANLKPEFVVRMCELAASAARIGRSIPRMPSKFDEPASVFCVLPGSES